MNRDKQFRELDRLLTAVLEGGLPLETAIQDEACRKDANLSRMLREEAETAQRLRQHSARTGPLPPALLHGRQRLEALIRQEHADWKGIFRLKRLDLGISIALLLVLLLAGTAQLIWQGQHAIAIAMPGDTHYFLKIAWEEVRLDLAQSPEARLRLHLDSARQRSRELESLVLEEQYALLPQTLAGLESALVRAKLAASQLQGELPPDIHQSMDEIEATVRLQVVMLHFYRGHLPTELRADVERMAWIAFDSQISRNNP